MRNDCPAAAPASSRGSVAASNRVPTARTFNMTVKDVVRNTNVIADRLTMSAHFLPIKETYTVDRLAELYIKEIMERHGVPVAIGSWDEHLSLIEFAYNNSYHASIRMPPYKALYGRRCRSPLYWDEVGERKLLGPDLVQRTRDIVQLVIGRLAAAQDRQRKYADLPIGKCHHGKD
ncbi:uncharacterized protein LOC141660483 [Apium graveolens]|uniref:uncharacterized protein LOC141660483 n=1 Tax=Apium graveolens TaxID=4045 RepID=UPI003D7BD63E